MPRYLFAGPALMALLYFGAKDGKTEVRSNREASGAILLY